MLGVLENSWLLIPVLSRAFFRSPWCMRELREFLKFEQSVKEQNRLQGDMGLVFPVRYLDFEEDDYDTQADLLIKRGMLKRQWIDFRDLKPEGVSYFDTLKLLTRRLRAILEPSVGESSLEQLPVVKVLNIEEIEYGEGVQIELIDGERLAHIVNRPGFGGDSNL